MTSLYLRHWRLYRALSQEELAQLAGITRESVNRIERGGHGARPATLRKLAAALRVEPHELRSPPPGMEEGGNAED